MNTNDLFENWEFCKDEHEEMEDFFFATEEEVINELYEAGDLVTHKDKKIKEYLRGTKLDKEKEDIIIEIAESSVYDMVKENDKDGGIVFSINIDNVGMFIGIVMMSIISLCQSFYEEDKKLTINMIFERKEWLEMFEAGEMFDHIEAIFEGVVINKSIKKG